MIKQLCVVCGVKAATTSDHIPPKNIFPKPRPNNLIKVPCCFLCNNSGSRHDEEFRIFLSLQIGMESSITERLWKEGALKSLQHNQRLANRIATNSQEVDVESFSGVYLGKRRAVTMPIRAHNMVFDRIVRGLYFYHFDQILGPRISCRVTPLNGLPKDVGEIVRHMKYGSVGESAFSYRYSRVADSPFNSIWFLLFYNRYMVLVETRPKSGQGK